MPQARDEAGNIWEVDAQGNPIRLVQAAPQQGRVFADPGAQADLQQGSAQASNAATDAQINAATAAAQIAEARASAQQIQLENQRLQRELESGGVSADRRAELQDRISRLNQLVAQIDRVQQLFDQGPGSTSGIWGVQDYLPTDANARFDAAGAALSQQGLAAFRVPGTGTVSDRDAMMFDRANLPTASTRDSAVDEQLRGLRSRVDEEMRTLGLTPPNWRETTVDRFREDRPNAMTQTNVISGDTPMQSGGNTTSTPIPPQMQQEYQAWVLQNAATMTPESYTAFRRGLDSRYGFESGDYTGEAERIINGVKNGGTLNLTIPPVERDMTALEGFRNSVADNPLGAGAIGFANMGSFGGVQALAGDQYGALGEIRPMSLAIGEMLGTLAPSAAIGKLGGAATGAIAPRLLGGGTLANMGRGAAADATYGAIYGGVTGDNPLASAAEAGVGSLIGQGVGRTLAGAGRGVVTSAPVQAMRNAEIPLTVGQTIGGLVDRAEQRAMSIPFVGDMLRNRRIEGLQAFNQAAFREAGAPINFSPTAIGQEGLDQMGQAVSDAYTNATNGVTVPFDNQFATDFTNVTRRASGLPADARRRLGQVLDVRVAPVTDTGQMTGYDYQQALRGLRSARNSPPQQFAGFEDIYKDRISDVEAALTNQMMRGGGDSVVQGLTAANAANRNLRTLEDAANRNLGGSNTDTPQVFLPNQLQRAGLRTQQNFPGARPFADLADNAQQVLPNTIPNSGTTDRVMQAFPLVSLAGGAGLGFAAGGDAQSTATGAMTPAALMALLAAASSRTGQRAIGAALTQRNPTVRQFSDMMLRRSGLFGSAAVPLALSSER